jgi:hypothetical protein
MHIINPPLCKPFSQSIAQHQPLSKVEGLTADLLTSRWPVLNWHDIVNKKITDNPDTEGKNSSMGLM